MIKRLVDKPIVAGIVTAIVTMTYCGVVALFFMLMENAGSNQSDPPAFFVIGFMLILFVLSAAVCGILVFGVPIFFLIQKQIRSAGVYMAANLITFALVLVLIANILLLSQIIN